MNFLKLFYRKIGELIIRIIEKDRLFLNNLKVCILLVIAITVISSCTTKRVGIDHYEGSLDDRLKGLQGIHSMQAIFSIEFDKGDGVTITGDGILSLSEDTLDLQIYSLGFLVGEVKADKTGISSNPPVSRNRLILLVDGLRNSFFWWSIKEFERHDEEGFYVLSNAFKRLLIDKKTMLPLKQTIEIEEGKQLDVFYYEPSVINGFDFPSRLRIELSNYSVNLWIKDITISMK